MRAAGNREDTPAPGLPLLKAPHPQPCLPCLGSAAPSTPNNPPGSASGANGCQTSPRHPRAAPRSHSAIVLPGTHPNVSLPVLCPRGRERHRETCARPPQEQTKVKDSPADSGHQRLRRRQGRLLPGTRTTVCESTAAPVRDLAKAAIRNRRLKDPGENTNGYFKLLRQQNGHWKPLDAELVK